MGGLSYNYSVKNENVHFLIRLLLVGIIVFCLQPAASDARVMEALNRLQYFMRSGQPEEAEGQMTWVQSIEPWRTLPWSDLAVIYFGQGKFLQTIRILEPFSKEEKLHASALLTLAKGYEQSGRPGQIEETLLSLVKLNKNGTEVETAYQMLVKLYRSQSRFDEAQQSQSKLVQLAPKNKKYLFDNVLLSLALSPDKGLSVWESTSGKPGWLVQAGSQVAAANLEENEAVRLVKMGRAFGGVNHWDLAEYWLQQAVDYSPDFAEARAFLAEARQQRGTDGKEEINLALELAPESPGVRALAALYFRRQHEYVRAISLLNDNIVDEPEESTWYMELGSVLAETGKMEEAALAYQKAVELSPLDYAKQAELARFCVQYEYQITNLGLPAAKKAVDLAADVPEAQDVYGLALLAAGELAEAKNAFSVALSLNPEYAPTWLHIGQAAISAGDSTEAKQALLKAVEIAGNSKEGQIARRLLEQYYLIKLDPSGN